MDNENAKLSLKRYFSLNIYNIFNDKSVFSIHVHVTLLAWFTVKSLT